MYCVEQFLVSSAAALPGTLLSTARFYAGDDLLEKFSRDSGISVMVPAAHRLGNLGTNLGTILVTGCSKCPVYATGDYRGFLGSPLFSVGRQLHTVKS